MSNDRGSGDRTYTNGEVTVSWTPTLCEHSRLCFTQLRAVFDPAKRPWVNMQGATPERIVDQVKRCPSGALSYRWADESREGQ